jgi:uncharacterized membrane protein
MNKKIQKLSLLSLMAALCYIGFTFFKIDIPLGNQTTAIHFGNTFCVLAALMLGGVEGGLAGSIGMGIGDLLNPLYLPYFPKTFVLKLGIGCVAGLVAHKVFKLSSITDSKQLTKATFLSAGAGMLFNVVGEPIFGFFYNRYVFGVEQTVAEVLAKITAGTTLFNAITATVLASLFYLALRRALKNSSLGKKIFK